MYLQKIHIENYRLLTNIDIFLDRVLTLIVGKNNTGKTSVINLIRKTSLDKGTQRKTTENELPSLTQCTA